MTSHGIFRTICSETREETYLYPPQNSAQALSKSSNFFMISWLKEICLRKWQYYN